MADALIVAAGDPAPTVAMDLPTAPYPDLGPVVAKRSWLSRRYLLAGAGLLLLLSLLTAAALLWPRGSHPTAAAAPPPSSTAPVPSAPLTTLPLPAPTTSTPTTEAPTTITTPAASALSCSVLRAELQALQRRQAQIDEGEEAPTARQAANRAIGAQEHAIEQVMHPFCR
jgi:hypothetical protein